MNVGKCKSGVNQEPGWTRQEWIFEDPGNILRTLNCSKKKKMTSAALWELKFIGCWDSLGREMKLACVSIIDSQRAWDAKQTKRCQVTNRVGKPKNFLLDWEKKIWVVNGFSATNCLKGGMYLISSRKWSNLKGRSAIRKIKNGCHCIITAWGLYGQRHNKVFRLNLPPPPGNVSP